MSKYTHLGGTFWKSNTAVFCEGHALRLDPERVKVYFNSWAADAVRVYYHSFQRRAIHAPTFVALNEMYARDAERCYCGIKAIPNADPESFVVLDSGKEMVMHGLCANHCSGYAKDSAHVYFNGNVIKSAIPSTFVSLCNCYGRDDESVYYTQFRLNGVSPRRWRHLGGSYSRDDECVYFQNHRIRNAQALHFFWIEPFNGHFAYDGRQFYHCGNACSTAEYVGYLRQHASHLITSADLVENGLWQESNHSRSFEEPDETLSFFNSIRVDGSIKKIQKALGPGFLIPPSDWKEYFSNMSTSNNVHIAGRLSWIDDFDIPGPNREVRRWKHRNYTLVCMFDSDKVAGLVIKRSEHPID